MIKAEQIPDEVVEAATVTYTAEIYKGQATAREYAAAMRAAIAAALAAWPGKRHDVLAGHVRQFLILPLKENSDER